jgi:phosphoglycolate phosphatase
LRPARWRGQPIHAVLLDLDGTLVDTLGDFEAALTCMLADLGFAPLRRQAVATLIGKGGEHLVRQTLAAAAAPAALFDKAWALYQHHYRAINGQHASVYPGVHEGLVALQALGLPLLCVTNKPTAPAIELLRAKALLPHFEAVFGGDAFERKKPDPLPLLKACELVQTEPAQTLMVGDSANDVAAARAAGCPVVLLPYGYNHGEPAHTAAADALLPRLEAVAAALVKPPA